ncbi:MAG: hypothetical protein GYB68_06010, partial [Chloroflexi bacterium]|nr:hypothetical protein [Chloroflexota bacterium]
MATPQDALLEAISLIRLGKIEDARGLIIAVLRQDRDNAIAWALMYQVALNDEDRRACIENVLRLRPDDPWALERLEALNQPPSPARPPWEELLDDAEGDPLAVRSSLLPEWVTGETEALDAEEDNPE